MNPWLQRLRHDLLKRALWTARDLRDLGAHPTASDLRALAAGLRELADPEGRPIAARALFSLFLEDAPPGSPGFSQACDTFGQALGFADAAVGRALFDAALGPAAVAAVLQLEPAFEALARSMNPRI